jgi:hypothetical protein
MVRFVQISLAVFPTLSCLFAFLNLTTAISCGLNGDWPETPQKWRNGQVWGRIEAETVNTHHQLNPSLEEGIERKGRQWIVYRGSDETVQC